MLTDENFLEVVKQGLTNLEAKQILRQIFRKNLHDRYMKESGKGFEFKLKMENLVKLFSEKAKDKKRKYINSPKHTKQVKYTPFPNRRHISFMNRIQ